MNPLAALIIEEIPGIIQMIKDKVAKVDPTLPPLTDADAQAILLQAITSTIAKDDAYLAVHPPK